MSLFDDLAKNVLGQLSGGDAAQAGGTNWIALGMSLLERSGGLDGLLAKFQQHGLGDLVTSWIGNGQNLPISAEQIKQVLSSVLPKAAADAGTDTETAAEGLASSLPDLISKLTPSGESGGLDLKKAAESLLGGDISKLFG